MATLPPVTLGAIILISFAMAFALHRPLEKRFMEPAAEVNQPQRQFLQEVLLVIGAGTLADDL